MNRFLTIYFNGSKTLLLTAIVSILSIFATLPLPCYSLPVSHYASHSVLSEGNWATVKVSESGMHLIPDATLRNLGFSDPTKVRVYGTGGAMEPEALSADMADDLPLVASVHNGKGIVFYANDHFTWTPINSTLTPYSHTINAYSHESIYFLSDRELPDNIESITMNDAGGSNPVTTFTARTVYEKETDHLGESGRTYLGEDFRSSKSQVINLSLPDNAGQQVTLRTRFAAKTIGGKSNLKFTANGAKIIGARGDTINSTSEKNYAALSTTTRTLNCSESKIALGIEFNYSGVLYLARLDYVEAFYTRRLRLADNGLHFYGTFEAGSTLQIEGCDASTIIWDITDQVRPKKVTYRLQGSNALISIPGKEYREFVALNPSKVTRNAVIGSKVSNQDLHSLESPDMLIISPTAYMEGAEMIAGLHRDMDKMNVLILQPEHIYNEFSGGKPDVGAFRKLLKMWHDRGGAPKYCLIMGKPSFDNKMLTQGIKIANYVPTPIWQSSTGLNEEESYSTDDYIGMLDDVEANRFAITRAKLHVAVGRIPCTDAAEARTVAGKIVKFCTNAELGAWRNKIMMIADDADSSNHFNQTQTMYNNMAGSEDGKSFLYDRLYLDSYPLVYTAVGASYPQATERMLKNYNEGVVLTTYIGHASSVAWGHEHLWEWEQIQAMNNKNLTFIYGATCRFVPWDEHEMSGGLHLMLNANGGVVGMLAASRTVYIDANGKFSAALSRSLVSKDADGKLKRIGDSYLYAKNNTDDTGNKLRYIIMGDPAMRLNNISHSVAIDTIAGTDVNEDSVLPEIKGGEKMQLSGRVLDHSGNTDTGFNGTLSLLLYDAESVIETYGNGTGGIKEMYNDRTTRLGAVNVSVKQGQWAAQIHVPLEISNNYQPALLSAYAWSESGIEAHGSSEQLYLYGFIDDTDIDTEGPEIEQFYLNKTDFTNGSVVNTNPLVFARLNDPSGINLSEGGVGHRLSLRLDDNTIYNDVAQYFTPDNDGTGGSIVYPLSDLAPGTHTLTLEAWDNLNNATRKSIDFGVSASADPYIVKLHTDVNPATTGVNFILDLDQPNTKMKLLVEVFDLNGRTVWASDATGLTDQSARISTYWNLCNKSGIRVPRGIYLYRARVETPQGTYSSKTNRLAVSAQ